ncbi:MAG: hypothetical protein RLZ35_1, partial [Pseudomonadota bacterium]
MIKKGTGRFFRIGMCVFGLLCTMGPALSETFKVGLYEAPPLVFTKKST